MIILKKHAVYMHFGIQLDIHDMCPLNVCMVHRIRFELEFYLEFAKCKGKLFAEFESIHEVRMLIL